MNRILSERFNSMVDQSTGPTFNLFALALSAALGVSELSLSWVMGCR